MSGKHLSESQPCCKGPVIIKNVKLNRSQQCAFTADKTHCNVLSCIKRKEEHDWQTEGNCYRPYLELLLPQWYVILVTPSTQRMLRNEKQSRILNWLEV